jgi:hypothetical protein
MSARIRVWSIQRELSMTLRASCLPLLLILPLVACAAEPPGAPADEPAATVERAERAPGVHKVKHVIIVMQENHSFRITAPATGTMMATAIATTAAAAGATITPASMA